MPPEWLPYLNQLQIYGKAALEIGFLYLVIYSSLAFLRGTRGAPILVGLTVIFFLTGMAANWLGLEVLDFLITKVWTILPIVLLIIFQPELRRAFAELGSSQGAFYQTRRRSMEAVETLIDTMYHLGGRKIGALVAIERNIGMRTIAETGTPLDTPLNANLLATIFYPNTPLHDGGVIVKDGRMVAAGCIFPLSQNDEVSRSLGTRHRAGVGITEETDCVTIIVSEETGKVSLAHKGHLVRDVDKERLRRHLTNYLVKTNTPEQAPNSSGGLLEKIDHLKQAVKESESKNESDS